MVKFDTSNVANLPTKYGEFKIIAFREQDKEHLVVFTDNLPQNPLIRVHSECLTGDVFGSQKCDCGDELHIAMEKIAKEGGIIIYLRQEGRNIGLLNKVNAYALQDKGYDTVEANLALGFRDDERNYEILYDIFKYFDIKKVRLLTNNPKKVEEISKFVECTREPIKVEQNCYNMNYLKTKKDKLGHLI